MGGLVDAIFGGPSAPAPDPNIGASAVANSAIAKEGLAFSKQVYEEGKPRQQMIDDYTKRVVDSQLASQDTNNALAADYANYMKGTFRPIEGSLAGEAMKDPTAEAELAAQEAGAGVGQQFGIARQNKAREMASMGINPNSGRWDATNQSSLDTQAAATADAMNKARLAGRNLSWAKRMDAAGIGRNLPSSQATSSQTALTAGSNAITNAAAGGINARADAVLMNQGYGGAVNANQSSGNLSLGQYNAQLSGYNAKQAADAAMWSGIGQGAGMFFAA